MTGVPIFVGELNPYGADPYYALYCEPEHSAGGRLCRVVCGLRRPTYLGLRRANLCIGDWTMLEARRTAGGILVDRSVDVIVMFGRKVATAFDYRDIGFTSAQRQLDNGRTVTLVSLPHPSGRCRQWYWPDAPARARALLREVCPAVPWGEAL